MITKFSVFYLLVNFSLYIQKSEGMITSEKNAQIGEFPGTAGVLRVSSGGKKEFISTGAIIHPLHVLSGVPWIFLEENFMTGDVRIVAGTVKWQVADCPTCQERNVTHYYNRYDPDFPEHDMWSRCYLYRVNKAFEETKEVKLLTLYYSVPVYDFIMTAAGWGPLSSSSTVPSDDLKWGTFKVCSEGRFCGSVNVWYYLRKIFCMADVKHNKTHFVYQDYGTPVTRSGIMFGVAVPLIRSSALSFNTVLRQGLMCNYLRKYINWDGKSLNLNAFEVRAPLVQIKKLTIEMERTWKKTRKAVNQGITDKPHALCKIVLLLLSLNFCNYVILFTAKLLI